MIYVAYELLFGEVEMTCASAFFVTGDLAE
ncbi:hypothetical protein LAUMK191_00527 [Mycobacterium attenuatum]|uniref:Uncharacterized protein n=1 Tax=Mycobacterium attenuatum TaxID=2341086 RepID=A0A498PPU2_9MYCO|nr:hypothetical protein LAUMK136_00533 [Mycobacterium attenuatum]VBA46100.1 hypothetical protein LAUMK191_00527 [Mycobacterium attenuatum]VBA47800.1 hypothetical protein LAUMK41_00598 [Mycobacterium attenuatum]